MSQSILSPLVLWAKSRRGEQDTLFHPLLFHLLDVAAVTEAIWDRVLAPAATREIAAGLGLGTDVATARWWIIFLAGAHDIGKASPAFQYCTTDGILHRRLTAAGFSKTTEYRAPHGTISTVILSEVLVQDCHWDETTARTMAIAIGGHHGIFPSSNAQEADGVRYGRGIEPWPAHQRELLAQLVGLLNGMPGQVPHGVTNAAAMTVAGLVSVADWIGSDDSRFPYAEYGANGLPLLSPESYRDHAQQSAAAAITDLRWRLPAETGEGTRDFGAIVDFKFAPNPTQQATIDRAADIHAPGLTIIESPMGEGKTEAALYLMEHAARVLGAPGCYVALPTQATSNQMFARVVTYLKKRFPASADAVNVQLLHGHADLSAAFALLRAAAETGTTTNDLSPANIEGDAPNANASVVAAEWFTYRKRGLLAPFGVGTVDQGLLAVLQTRHVFVRLFGLAHKCVIIDEVHAYDTYMTTLLGRLLMWLGALGCPVVLLSATLPNARRADLLRAYAEGTGHALDRSIPLPTAPYPRLSWVENGVAGAAPISGVSPRSTKRVRVVWVDGTVPEENGADFPLGELLRERLANGGCAAVICNTVARAQAVYHALQRYFPDDELARDKNENEIDGHPALDLLHSRYRFMERQKREQRTLLRFGKPGETVEVAQGGATSQTVNRPHRAVLVATQIIEQSLDLDFDLMVTDIAPADLVLQRLGRLHRHDRPRRPTGDDCILYLCGPVSVSPEGVPTFEQHFDRIYHPHVLLRSWLSLRDRKELSIPNDIEGMIEAIYNEVAVCPGDISEALRVAWQKTLDAKAKDDADEEGEAEKRHLKRPDYSGELWHIVPALALEEDAPDFHQQFQALTRLTDENESVVLLYPHEGGALFDGKLPSLKRARELLRRALTVSTRRAVAIIREEGEQPSAWKKSRLLRHHYCVRLDADGSYGKGKNRLHYDRDEGLIVIQGSEVIP